LNFFKKLFAFLGLGSGKASFVEKSSAGASSASAAKAPTALRVRSAGQAQGDGEQGKTSPSIKSVGAFPSWVDVISGPSMKGGLNIPAHLQYKVLAVKINSSTVAIAYAPTEISKVKAYLPVMRSEIQALGLTIQGANILADEEVLEAISKAATSKKGGQSGGAVVNKSESVQQFREWAKSAHDLGATDLHMRILDGGRGEVLIRIDGDLEALPQTAKGVTDRAVLSAMKAAYETLADRHSNNDGTFSEAKSMSCMLDSALGIPNLRMRFGSQRGFFGPKAALRLLTSESNAPAMSFEAMGFAPSHIETLEKIQRVQQGIILQCGITGSGKTTAAKTLLETHPRNGSAAFYQVADPIEYFVDGVHQIYVQRDLITLSEAGKKSPYQEVMESLLRMDIDLVDVGEIRDEVSVRAATAIAKSGHLAVGTLHTKSIAGVLNRLTDPALGLDRSELTSDGVIALLTHQSLIPKLCPHCRQSAREAKVQLIQLGNHREAAYVDSVMHCLTSHFKVATEGMFFRNLDGCDQCGHRGTRGLTIAAEMMIPDDEWLDLSATGNDRAAWRNFRQKFSNKDLTSSDMTGKTSLEHALYKVIQGWVDPRQLNIFGTLENFEVLK
jgi:general secretion pathway protein E